MTVSSDVRKAGPYACNGALVLFPFSFKCFDEQELKVWLTDAEGVDSLLLLDSQYTLALNVDQEVSPGGVVTTLVAYGYGQSITLQSSLIFSQDLDLINAGAWQPDAVETALDRIVIMCQQLQEELSRTFKVSVTSTILPGDSIAEYLEQAAGFQDAAEAAAAEAENFANAAAADAQTADSLVDVALVQMASVVSATLGAVQAMQNLAAQLAAPSLAYIHLHPRAPQGLTEMYTPSGWDLGGVASAAFPNESALRAADLALGDGSFNCGSIV